MILGKANIKYEFLSLDLGFPFLFFACFGFFSIFLRHDFVAIVS